jgi:hypothetical protein
MNTVSSQAQKQEVIQVNPQSFSYNTKLPFSHIDIVDSRFDTTKIGYSAKFFSFKKLTVAPSFSSVIQNSLNTSLKSNFDSLKNSSLLLVIKHFWLKEAFIKEQSQLGSQCIAKFELYLKTDTAYFPIIRINTVFTYDVPLKNDISGLVLLPFEQSLRRIENINFEKILGSKKLK